LEEIHEASIVP